MSGSPNRRGSSSNEASAEPEASERSSAEGGDELDLAEAVRAAKNAPPGQQPQPASTAKIRPFQLAEALARLRADSVPDSTLPEVGAEKRTSQLNVSTPAIDITRDDLVAAGATRPSLPAGPGSTPPATPNTSGAVVRHQEHRAESYEPAAPRAATSEAAGAAEATPQSEVEPAALPARKPFNPLVLVPLVLGVALLVYAYVLANR